VRDLAVELNINANTVARIYADLEREGYLVRRRGIGTFAADRADTGQKPAPPGRAQLTETLRQLRALGYSKRQIIELAGEVLEELDTKVAK
jgi:GntR family transcriptional regulator